MVCSAFTHLLNLAPIAVIILCMPAAKKRTFKRSGSNSQKAVSIKPKAAEAKKAKYVAKTVSKKKSPAKKNPPKQSTPIQPFAPNHPQQPAEPVAEKNVPTSQMPMPVRPQHLPAKTHVPMIRTAYNATRFRWMLAGLGVVIIGVVATIGWGQRDKILPLLGSAPTAVETAEIYQLTISPTPTPNQSLIKQAEDSLFALPEQGTQSAEPNLRRESNSPTDFQASIENYTLPALKSYLNDYIHRLDGLGVDTQNLHAYRQRVLDLESKNQAAEARQWAIESIIHARELEITHRYHH